MFFPQLKQLAFLIAMLNTNSGCLLFKPKFALQFIQIIFFFPPTKIEVNQRLKQEWTNPGLQVARATKFWYGDTVTGISGPSPDMYGRFRLRP